MNKKLKCPECGYDKFNCEATINADFTAKYDGDAGLDYKMQQWDWNAAKHIECFECQNCDFFFEGDEGEFIEFLEANSPTVIDEAS